MLNIRCPHCLEMSELVDLFLADWEEGTAHNWELGNEKRVSLVCLKCKREFILQGHLTQVVPRKI